MLKHIGTLTIETERLNLRRFKLSDADAMFKNYTNSEKVCEFLTWQPHEKIENTIEYLEYILPLYEKLSTYRWAIELKETGEVIGAIDVIDSIDDKRRCELGWVLGDKYWGKGYMPEAAKAVIKYLFDVGYLRVQAIHDVANPKSGRVMEKAGMTYEGILKKYELNNKDELTDCAIWAIIKEGVFNV